ncbi:transcriptional elongation regulator MINIYO-like isoform X2 [Primulina huaijiensis]|uniref:transcriptional elongation regulator MINIYO-like isoform X2 n=1 Tax=Primulina huaijiensis TaxID=1492673 RepID=UPI003CC71B4D
MEGTENRKSKILGATPLHVSEEGAALLVGAIVEKGFQDNQQTRPSSNPRPSVLSFPVARHRSHGPHWAPKVGNFKVNNDDGDFCLDGEEDFNLNDLAADLANPIQRKEKRSLDFRRWQGILKDDGSFLRGKESNLNPLRVSSKVNEISCHNIGAQIYDMEEKLCHTSYNNCEGEQFTANDMSPSLLNDTPENIKYPLQMATDDKFLDATQIDGSSLESHIDAENRARLLKMSADEIAEAQAEIMAKLSPDLIKSLKRRSQEREKKLKFSLSDTATGGEAVSGQQAENSSNSSVNFGCSNSHKPEKEIPGDKPSSKENKVIQDMDKKNHCLWNAWSKRVERVKNLRFSLDGNIMGSNITDDTDTVSERDFLRTEGDPGAAGYTIMEAVVLTRSVVSGQRTLALHLIAAVLDRAICCLCQNKFSFTSDSAGTHALDDWEAIWAFALGPGPELALSLRMSLDDNHNSVILACAKAIQCALSYDMNEIIFDISENASTHSKYVFTAPVLRSRPDINSGFLRGGFWKYSAKPSNIDFIGEELGDEPGDERTIQDDLVVARQDIAAGLIRMGILPRICYLMETDPSAPLEECLISILIAIARHSPTCAAAVMNCEKLVQTVANRFTLKEHMEINPCKIKSVKLIKVLACSEKKSCSTFIKNGIFRQMTWHLYRNPCSLDQLIKSGKEASKYLSALLVEQWRFWKVCIRYGYCISDFSDLLASVCIWLRVPNVELLIENDVMSEFFSITKEIYLLLDVLAGRLPNFYSVMHETLENSTQDTESFSWSHIGPITDHALEWIRVKTIPYVSKFFGLQAKDGGYRSLQDPEVNSLLQVISSVLSMLSSVLKAVIPVDTTGLSNGNLPWIPDFVPKIGLEIIRNGYMGFFGESNINDSVLEKLFHLRLKNRQEIAIYSTCCLQGLIQVVASIDKLIQHANLKSHALSKYSILSRDDKVLAEGILKSSMVEVRDTLTTLMTLINNECQSMHHIEVFGRGGPAPGVGVGWGASGGGYWSLKTLLVQQDTRLLTHLLEVSEISTARDSLDADEMGCLTQRINCALAAGLIVGPVNSSVFYKLLNFMFQVPVLKHLDFSIRQFLCLRKGFKPLGWNYEEQDYLLFANVLAAHFKNRWLGVKNKLKAKKETNHFSHKTKKGGHCLETIHEDVDLPNMIIQESTSLIMEWAYQRLHLPAHWFLSAISTFNLEKNTSPNASSNSIEVTKGGLFFLLCIEAIPTFSTSEAFSPVKSVPVVWKLHALSVVLLFGMNVLEDEKSRDIYESLQKVYGEILDEKFVSNLSDNLVVNPLKFESDIHENYSTFIETLVGQFAAESYGDIIFGRQVAIYLNRSVETSVRHTTWNALSNARVLELLPPLDQCLTKYESYLEPVEDDERILEAYVKSWVSGALDKAATRNSAAFSLVLHHLSCFIFQLSGHMLSLRNKLVKFLLRDYSRKQQHEGMLVKLIQYKKHAMTMSDLDSPLSISGIEKRLQLLKEICQGASSLMVVVEKLESCLLR